MLNPDLKLNPDLFDPNVEKLSTRQGFGEGLLKAGETDKNVVALCADLIESTAIESFKKKFPERYIEMGVAEQNLVTVASGMASMGKIPFAASYAIFSPGRNWEQIRTTICYNNVTVKIIGSHTGVTVGPDGGSHQALEDIALMRVLPRMVVISPCDSIQARKATLAAAKTKDPTYIRLARDKTPIMTTDETPFEIGKAQVVYTSPTPRSDLGIITTGPCLYRVLKVAHKLSIQGKNVTVMNLHTIKPLDGEAIVRLAHQTKALVTVEDHQVFGGMGSAVAEHLVKHFPVPIEFVGIKDKFGQSGTPEELVELYEIGEKHIHDAAMRVMLRK